MILEKIKIKNNKIYFRNIPNYLRQILINNEFLLSLESQKFQWSRYNFLAYKKFKLEEKEMFEEYLIEKFDEFTKENLLNFNKKDTVRAISEMFANVKMHTNSEKVVTCGYYDKDKKEMYFTISNHGITISKTIERKNGYIFEEENGFYEYLRYNPLDDLLDDSDYTKQIIYNDVKNKFFKFILSSICSFERREEHRKYSFCEEYVLPQMLAQIIKKNDFNGIIYSSTRLNSSENDKLYKTAYKDNVAIFTDYCREHVYDSELYKKFKISNPICINQISEIDLESLQEICDKIKLLDNDKKFENYYLIAVRLEEEFSKIKIGDKEYFKHNIGKMHIYLVYNMLIDIRNECIRKRRDINGIND